MKEKSKKILIVVGVLLVLVVGVSLAYFTSQVLSSGNGAVTNATTATIMDTTFLVEGTLEFNDVDIYPGHKQVSAIKVTATGDNQVVDYNVIWEGINSLYTGLNYTVYKTTTPIDATATCEKKTSIQDGAQLYSEECSISNIDSLGESISTGSITRSDETRKIILAENESITSTKTGEVVYYYVVIEYPNLSGVQNQDTNGTFDGIVTVERYTDSTTCGTHNVTTALGVLTVNDCEPIYGYSSDAEVLEKTCTYNGETVMNYSSYGVEGVTEESCNVVYQIDIEDEAYLYFDSSFGDYEYVGEGIWNSDTSTCTYNNNDVYDWWWYDSVMSQKDCGAVYYSANNDEYLTKINKVVGNWDTPTITTGIYEIEDDDGTSYYFRGNVDNNYVKFANKYWRIVRINGNGSLRLVYDGTTAHANGESSSDRQIGTSAFNSSYNDNAYVGFMYGKIGSTTYGETHANINSSTIKTYLDSWYANNLASYASYLDTNAGFCGDRSMNTTEGEWWFYDTAKGYGTEKTIYSTYNRIWYEKQPSAKCTNSNDLYTVGSAINGNRALINPIGLLTADEVMMAGSNYAANTSYYLYTGNWYWTMSPNGFFGDNAYVFTVSLDGDLYFSIVNYSSGVRPVINLKAGSLNISGNGTISNPYVIA